MKRNLHIQLNSLLLKIIFSTGLILSLVNGKSQVFYGVAQWGGTYGGGVLFKSDITNDTLTAVVNFARNADGGYLHIGPIDGLLLASDGKLYGVTSELGANKLGSIYSYNPANGSYKELYSFDNTNGALPSGGLIQFTDGKLYGTTLVGGNNRLGVIYSYDPSTGVYTKLKDFNGTDGSNPGGRLTIGPDGKIWGITSQGGVNNPGVIFSYDPATSTYTDVYEFTLAGGSLPVDGLTLANNGKFYGMTNVGGAYYYGTIYSFDPATLKFTDLKDFNYDVDGGSPNNGFVQASDGKLYGMTYEGGTYGYGVLFSLDPTNNAYTKLKEFTDFCAEDGSNPSGSLIQASDGKLYGSTAFGGSSCGGTIFSYDITKSAFSKLQDFNGTNGSAPWAFLTEVCDHCTSGTTISIANKTITEGNAGVKLLWFPVTLSNKSSKPVIVNYTTKSSTAKAGSDFIAENGKLYFPAGVTKLFIIIAVRGDEISERNEKFFVNLSKPVNASFGDSTATGTIVDNDGSQLNATAAELITKASVQISPNPAYGKVTILLKGYSANVIISISTIEGKLLKQDKLKLTTQYQADISSYAAGTYIVTATDDKGNKQSVKLVVSH